MTPSPERPAEAGERPPISCYIRTLNEENRIGAAVLAALQVAREVVVVDSGSTDGTVAAAEAAGARIVKQPWLGGGHLSRKQASAMVRRVRFLDDGRRRPVALRVWFGLPVFFLRNYLLRGQWREGRYGFLFALTTAYNHWLRYAMLYERQRARGDTDRRG